MGVEELRAVFVEAVVVGCLDELPALAAEAGEYAREAGKPAVSIFSAASTGANGSCFPAAALQPLMSDQRLYGCKALISRFRS